MTAPIALQLYTLREALAKDYRGTLEKVAAIGYMGVEVAGFPEGITPDQAKGIFDELGLAVTSAHAMLPLGENKTEVLEALAAIQCNHLVSPWMDPERYQSIEGIKALAGIFNQAYEVCAQHGLGFSIHNHSFEFQRVGQALAIQILKDYLNSGVGFELDTYWIQAAGQDPVKIVADFGARAPLLHIKDGPAIHEAPQQAVGDGILDIPAIIAAGAGHTAWLIVELDECATDMLVAVDRSYRYLTTRGLARGKV